jgi:membrane-anchored protein YejM (alkaline phosphatase superfamily)
MAGYWPRSLFIDLFLKQKNKTKNKEKNLADITSRLERKRAANNPYIKVHLLQIYTRPKKTKKRSEKQEVYQFYNDHFHTSDR